MLEILLNKKLNDDLIFPVDKGVCKNGDDCICLPEWSGALCDQGKLKKRHNGDSIHVWMFNAVYIFGSLGSAFRSPFSIRLVNN